MSKRTVIKYTDEEGGKVRSVETRGGKLKETYKKKVCKIIDGKKVCKKYKSKQWSKPGKDIPNTSNIIHKTKTKIKGGGSKSVEVEKEKKGKYKERRVYKNK